MDRPNGRTDCLDSHPAPFFLSVVSPNATKPNGLMNLAYVGAVFLAAAVLTLGIGLIRA